MPRDNNPKTTSSDGPSKTRDNNPTTIKRTGYGTGGGEEVCPSCGSIDWETRDVPSKGDGKRTADVCQSCGYVTPEDEPTNADKK